MTACGVTEGGGTAPGDTIQGVTSEWKKCAWIYKECYRIDVGRWETASKKGIAKKVATFWSKNRGHTVREVIMTKHVARFFSGKNIGDTISLRPRVTQTLVTPLNDRTDLPSVQLQSCFHLSLGWRITFHAFCSCDLDLDPMTSYTTWPDHSEDVPAYRKWTF